jgi:segregation and condensation protein B
MSEAQVAVSATEIEVPVEVKNIIEALIFASDEPLTVKMIRTIVEEANKERLPHEQITINAEVVRKAVGDLNRGYGRLGSGFRIIEIAGGFVFATQNQFAAWVGKLAKEKARRRLSSTAVETLAIIAYKQPITKSEVEFIRGVNVDYIINALLEKGLIQITGRQSSPGRPLLYGTTQKFLEHFGLNDLTDLPKPREIAELINETETEVDRRLLAEQQELAFKETLENKLEGHEGGAKKEKKTRQPRIVPPAGEPEKASEKIVSKPETTDGQPLEAGSVQPEIIIPQSNGSTTVEQVEETPVVEVITSDEKSIDESSVMISNITHSTSDGEVPIEQETEPQRKIFGEEGAELFIPRGNITEGTEHPQPATSRPQEQQVGWSKWKNKVKTFFKKLFG